MFYTVYKITNQVNGKIYIGVHKTDDLNDDYMGSGTYLNRAKEKYGLENFTREYLQVFDNAEDMFEMESQLVNEEFVARGDTYNLKLGGNGGFSYLNSIATPEQKSLAGRLGGLAYHKRYSEDEEFRAQRNEMSRRFSEKYATDEAFRNAILEKRRDVHPNGSFYGKHHSEETKSRMSEKAKLRTGEKSSGFGSMWITNGTESKKIKKDDMIPDGWRKGRKM